MYPYWWAEVVREALDRDIAVITKEEKVILGFPLGSGPFFLSFPSLGKAALFLARVGGMYPRRRDARA